MIPMWSLQSAGHAWSSQSLWAVSTFGSSSLISTMNGVSSKDVVPTGGPYGFTLLPVSLRLCGLVLEFVTVPLDCKVGVKFLFAFAYMTYLFSSLLIILRITAIWNRNKFVVALSAVVWLTTASFVVYGITQIQSERVPLSLRCEQSNAESNKLVITALPVTDLALLIIMLIGLFRIRHRGGGRFVLGQLLWKQGVVYLSFATIAEITPVAFLFPDLNVPLEQMFLMPSLITMSIVATRMYRSLADFFADTGDGSDNDNPPNVERAVPITKRISTISLPMVAVYTSTSTHGSRHRRRATTFPT